MSSETLSQEEIDLLFDGQRAPAPAARRTRPPDVQVYDFRRPSRISKDRQRSLEAMYDLLAKTLENWLTGRVRSQVEMNLLEVQQFSFGEFVMSLPTPCSSFVFDIADSGGQQGVIDFGPELAFYLVDRLLGGSGPPVVLEQALTPLERTMVWIAAERITNLLSEIWRDHVKLDLELSRFESIPDMLQIANREDPVLVANIEVSADGMRSPLLVCLPFGVLEKFFTTSGCSGSTGRAARTGIGSSTGARSRRRCGRRGCRSPRGCRNSSCLSNSSPRCVPAACCCRGTRRTRKWRSSSRGRSGIGRRCGARDGSWPCASPTSSEVAPWRRRTTLEAG